MSNFYLGEIRLFAYGFAPQGWLLCDGSVYETFSCSALAELLGGMYGGNWPETFAVPDLRGRVPVGGSEAYPQGLTGGAESVALTLAQVPQHSHGVRVSGAQADAASPKLNYPAVIPAPSGSTPPQPLVYQNFPANVPLATTSISTVGHGGGHPNVQPSLVLCFCIAATGATPYQA